MKFTQHPLSAAYPPMSDDEFAALKQSIDRIGVQLPITLFEGQVIDGWHRYLACKAVGIPCPTTTLDRDIDPQDFAKSQGTRRNLSAAQTAMAFVAIYDWHPVGSNQHGGSALSAHPPKTTAELAKMSGVGARTISQAKAVQSNATAAVIDAVKRGEVGLPKATAVSKLPPQEQAAALAEPLKKPSHAEQPIEAEPDENELAADALAAAADALFMEQLLASDDALATAHQEIKRLNQEVSHLTVARNGYMRTANEAIAKVKSLQRKVDQLSREKHHV